MTARDAYVPTPAIRSAVAGREAEVLSALGIALNDGFQHINCPYPTHADVNPSWRWDAASRRAFCTCTKSDSIFDVVCKARAVGFDTAKIIVAEIIGRHDLIRRSKAQGSCRADASSLLNPDPDNQDDELVWLYLAHRLGIPPAEVPRPTTKVVGIKSLPYFDSPQAKGGKTIFVGDFPAAIFETVDRDNRRHAHRIYLAPGGVGKAELGMSTSGKRREPKKSATKTRNENTAGRVVIWGDPSKASTAIICEGIETAAAVALAFHPEVGNGEMMIAACINAGGVEAFKVWPSAKRVIVAADRDEISENGRPATRRGEVAAKRFAELHHAKIATSIALPGEAGKDVDWLNVLERTGMAAVRDGVLAAEPFSRFDAPQNQQQESDAEVIARLARSPPLEYDRQRVAEAEKLSCRPATLDALVKAARADSESSPGQGRPITLPEVEPWDQPVAGATLLDELSDTISTYVILSKEQADAVALWCTHTYAHDNSDVSPHLNPKSAQKRSGKSRLVHVVERLVPRPLSTSGITAAALFRIIETKHPTLLLDELDALMNKDREIAEALRGIMNSAFERASARHIVNVAVASGYEPREFSTWAPLLLAGIGNLPDTVRDRSIEIEMVRKRRDEIVRRLRRRDGGELLVLARKLARWVSDNVQKIKEKTPTIPAGLSDRAADAWEPLLAIADVAGEEWPNRARRAALALSGEHSIEDDNVSTQLLSDIRSVFTEAQLKSETLVDRLRGLEDRPWAEFGRTGKGLTQNTLAKLLQPYLKPNKVRPITIRVDPQKIRGDEKPTGKGYKLSWFIDVFERYLPDLPKETVTPSQARETEGFSPLQTVTRELDVTDEKSQKTSNPAGCDGVTDGNAPLKQDEYGDLAPEEETTL
jgi:hypothetical protein